MEKADWTFEEQWQQTLGNAEVNPPEQVWVAIDGSLANEQALNFKKQADFYRWVAAACLFLITFGGGYYWMSDNADIQNDLAETKELSGSLEISEGNPIASSTTVVLDEQDQGDIEDVNKSVVTPKTADINISPIQTNHTVLSEPKQEIDPNTGSMEVKSINRYGPEQANMIALTSKSVDYPSSIEPWQTDHLYGVARTWENFDESYAESPLWAGVSFSTGAFDPGFGSGSDRDMVFASHDGFVAESANVRSQPASPAYASGQSIAGGVNVGKKFARRVVLSSGLHYSAFNTGSATSQIVADANNSYALTSESGDRNLEDALSSGNLRYAGEQVELANEYQYLTIPIKAGYVLLDNKFNITLNTGLSSNILVDSKLVSEGSDQSLDNDFSTSGSYQNVYFNFLTSVEFGYLFKQHYQFLLEPNYNQAITEFTNSNHSGNAKPRNVGIAIGFRYNF